MRWGETFMWASLQGEEEEEWGVAADICLTLGWRSPLSSSFHCCGLDATSWAAPHPEKAYRGAEKALLG